MKQFFKHFGSKARLAHRLPPPRFKTLIEPFAGSAAYTVKHAKPFHDVLLFDVDERVCTIWDFLIHASPADIMALPVEHFLNGGDIRDESLGLDQPRFLFLQRWMAISGTHSYSLAPCLRQDRDGMAGNVWCEMTRARIAKQVDKIRHWKIHRASYTECPDVEAHWHVDPPYQFNEHGHGEYDCEPLDYAALGQWCQSRQGDITVHEQEGATWLPFRTLKSDHITSRVAPDGKMKRAHEVYWTNEVRDRTGTLALF